MPKLQYNLAVEMEDGTTYEVVADQRDVAKFEGQEFGTSAADIGSKIYTAMRYLAYAALIRKGQLSKGVDWEKFNADCVEVTDPGKEEDGPFDGKTDQ